MYLVSGTPDVPQVSQRQVSLQTSVQPVWSEVLMGLVVLVDTDTVCSV